MCIRDSCIPATSALDPGVTFKRKSQLKVTNYEQNKLTHEATWRNPHRAQAMSMSSPWKWQADCRNLFHLEVENPTAHLLWVKPCTRHRPFLNIQQQAWIFRLQFSIQLTANILRAQRPTESEQRVERLPNWSKHNSSTVMVFDWFWSHPLSMNAKTVP